MASYKYKREIFNETSLTSVQDIFKIFSENLRTNNKFDAVSLGKSKFIFRGHSDSSWPLLPTAFRENNNLAEYCTQLPASIQNLRGGIKEFVAFHLLSEAAAVKYFIEEADRQGVNTPLDYNTFDNQFTNINSILGLIWKDHENFDVAEVLYLLDNQFPHKTLHSSFALAQHSGVPTRFLDFSESPYIALFFAAYNSFFCEDPKPENIAIFAFSSSLLSSPPISEEISLVLAPRHQNINALKQKGAYLVANNANSFYIQNRTWPTIEDIIIAHGDPKRLFRFLIPSSLSKEILVALYDLDITPYSIMPSLGSISKSVSYKKTLFDS